MPSSQKLQILLKPNCTWMFIGWSSTNFTFFVPIWNSKWRLWQDLVQHWTLWGKCFKTLLLWNHLDNWNQTAQEWSLEGPLQSFVFYADQKSKMATFAGHRLTLDPMGKMFQNASCLKLLGQLKPNCPGMIIGRSSTKFLFFNADPKSKMAATTGHSINTGPYGKIQKYFLLWSYCTDWT